MLDPCDDRPVVGSAAPVPVTASTLSSGQVDLVLDRYAASGLVLRVRGEIDSVTASVLSEQLAVAMREACESAAHVLVDLDGVSFLASAGLAALLNARDRAAAAGVELRLTCGGSRSALRALQVTGTLELFDVVDAAPTAPHD